MSKTSTKPAKPVRSSDVARVQSAVAVQHGGQVPKGSYVGRMQRTAATTPPPAKSGK
jgi:hypothetical protein